MNTYLKIGFIVSVFLMSGCQVTTSSSTNTTKVNNTEKTTNNTSSNLENRKDDSQNIQESNTDENSKETFGKKQEIKNSNEQIIPEKVEENQKRSLKNKTKELIKKSNQKSQLPHQDQKKEEKNKQIPKTAEKNNNIPETKESNKEISKTNTIKELLQTGDISNSTVSKLALINATLSELNSIQNSSNFVKNIYNQGSIEYDPTNQSCIIAPKKYKLTSGDYRILLFGSKKGATLALAGEVDSQRFAIYGSNLPHMFENGDNLNYQKYFKRVLSWLVGLNPDKKLTTQKIALVDLSDQTDVKNWLKDNYPKLNICEATTLNSCTQNASLVIIGDTSRDTKAPEKVRSILESKRAVLFMTKSWPITKISEEVGDYFDFSFRYPGNFYLKDLANWNSFSQMDNKINEFLGLNKLKSVLNHLKKRDFNFDWERCYKFSAGKKVYNSSGDRCEEVPRINSDFFDGARVAKEILNDLDSGKIDIFEQDGAKLWKLLVLLGDKLREGISFPMDKNKTPQTKFFESLFSEYLLYNYRDINPAQKDLGNFSRSNFNGVQTKDIKRDIVTKSPFRSAGVYILPGESVVITRVDNNSKVDTNIFINSIRDGATHIYEKDGYKRPRFLSSIRYPIAPGESIKITSSYGGILFIGASKDNERVSFRFENVAQHPVWAYWMSDEEKSKFEHRLAEDKFDWAEVITPNFELHSKRDKMIESLNHEFWKGDIDTFIDAINTYTSNYPYSLAGFQGPGIESIKEVTDFADAHNITIKRVDFVKHYNADQAACGYGCSGNPYDAYWAFNPVSHGDLHEIGHALESDRLRFEGWVIHSTTNAYAFYTQTKFNKDHENDSLEYKCQETPFKEVFLKLQEATKSSNPTKYLEDNLWASKNYAYQFMVQLQAMMQVQKMGKLRDGWHFLTRLHLLDRACKSAAVDQNSWESKKGDLGFDSYSLDEFKKISKNDWLLIAYSFASGLDFREFLDMFGIKYSTKAANQVASFGFRSVPKRYFVSTKSGFCTKDEFGDYLDKKSIRLDEDFPY